MKTMDKCAISIVISKGLRNVLTFLSVFNVLHASAQVVQRAGDIPDTTFITYTGLNNYIVPQHDYSQTLTCKIMLSNSLFDGRFKRKDNGESKVYLNYEQALEVIKKMDKLTLGIPKIVYVVGWQYNGHDSKYPAWFEGNERLKRAEDTSSLESLRWLMKQAMHYHTIVSVHINMFDAYEDSPLWDTYVKNNIIARNADGSLRKGEWGYPISYAQEWKTGYAQKRIDSLCKLLPLRDAGTVHIDAFHSWPPVPVPEKNGSYRVDLTQKGPISPYLKFTLDDETAAQIKIFKYWASKGIDVTSEGVDFLRATAFPGYQHMAWWYGGPEHYLKWPASYYCGGQDNSRWGKLFGTSMHGEDIIDKDPRELTGFKEQFCLQTVIWYYLNRHARLYLLHAKDYDAVQYADGIRTYLSKDEYKVTQGDAILVDNGDMLMPAPWIGKGSLIAYSKNGYASRMWKLPKDWVNVKEVKLKRIMLNDTSSVHIEKVENGMLRLAMEKDEMLLIRRL